MRIRLWIHKSVHENAAMYYEMAKSIKRKIDRLLEAIKETERKIEERKRYSSKVRISKVRDKKWYERFHWFINEYGHLVIGGKDNTQNEVIYKKYIDSEDLVFHADIPGASLVVLKSGVGASNDEMRSAAQFAACFSRAWKLNHASVDVYAVKKEQISKSAKAGEYLGKGSFIISGNRMWFKNIPLMLKIGLFSLDGHNIVVSIPYWSGVKLSKYLVLLPGGKLKKERAAKSIAKYLGDMDVKDVIQALPNGNIAIKKE